MKKSNKNNNNGRCHGVYHTTKNKFKGKAETRFIVIKRENALQQIQDALSSTLDGRHMKTYFDMSCFLDYPEELEEICAKVGAYLEFRAMLRNSRFGWDDPREAA